MRVTITKVDHDYYSMSVAGNRGPALAPRRGPGHGKGLPHDVAHLLVEVELNLQGGVFGRVARAKSTWFPLLDRDEQSRHNRRMKKWNPSPDDRADMAESERLAGIGAALVEQHFRASPELPDWFSRFPAGIAKDPVVQRIVARFTDFAENWRSLASGDSITIDWPGAPRP